MYEAEMDVTCGKAQLPMAVDRLAAAHQKAMLNSTAFFKERAIGMKTSDYLSKLEEQVSAVICLFIKLSPCVFMCLYEFVYIYVCVYICVEFF